MVDFYVSLGSNMGDRLDYLSRAIKALRHHSGIQLEAVSSIYETDPVGFTDQPAFLNMAAGGKTDLSPDQLLEAVMEIEKGLGRKREIHWGPRTIDIDILTYGRVTVEEEKLQVPHPRMAERAFVLIPLAEIASVLPISVAPNEYKTPTQLLEKVKDKSGVRLWKSIDWEIEFALTES
ncbi:2-amino-4-hydroxy-6-hydroxymethyldihydropteridine diphosphokinase [Ammoniphilus sp. YIM 78166]|uniref:2-amino-4-hydroxy-6- hydroxymethyldihydropteridine diphosphokinase n=1 Tax=Ammoniphilus sp. YIM 78166 TaxID=1644106 RepID=UPI00106FE81B|nr:2-amino-4-hydroxy-6-hydroxymethyldihydropteridine diphosphokinase [Ammoniphilus sp. YIM 78166]